MERCDYCGSILKIGNVSEFLEKIIKLINDDQLNVPSSLNFISFLIKSRCQSAPP